jgi:hypothetical protein
MGGGGRGGTGGAGGGTGGGAGGTGGRAADAGAPRSDAGVIPRDGRAADSLPPASNCPPGSHQGATLDPRTCLVWQDQVQAPRTNVAAAKVCDDLVLDGQSDWRLPAPEELATWPALAVDSNAYITGPTYIPATASPADGCTGNAHSCNITRYNANAVSCAWQGVGFTGRFVCVRGTAAAGTLPAAYSAASCQACAGHVTGASPEFKPASCLTFAR